MTLTFDGGPITYDYYGERFTVHFQDVVLNFRLWYGGASLSSVSGGVLIDGMTYVPMDQTLAGLIY